MKKLLFVFFLFLSYKGFSQAITEVFYPRYIQGVGSGTATDDQRIPYACRMTVSGLTANATYRYYNRFATDPVAGGNGQGNYIIVNPSTGVFTRPTNFGSLSVAGSYGEFTTSAAGSFTGWFICEPNIATDHYQPGTLLYFRILLNNGAGGGSVTTRITAANPVSVISFPEQTIIPIPPGFEATGIYNTANAALTAKNFIMLYDNTGGTGRPVSGTFIESDGTPNTTATEFYAPFYGTNVDGQARIWGSIIPNNLSNGINNISQYSLSNGSLVNACTSSNGVYGTVNTANATGGLTTPLIITCTPGGSTCSISLSTSATNVTCFGTTNGAVNLTVNGAVGPVTYAWTGPGGFTSVLEDISGLAAGTYNVIVRETGNPTCTATASATVTQPTVLVSASATGTIACNGGTTTVTVTATGGTLPYTGTGTFTRSAGAYSYTVTDVNGCTSVTSGTIVQPSQLVASSTAPPITTVGGSTTVTVTATGGTPPYTGTGTFVRTAGTYTFTVTDANGCTATTTIALVNPGCTIAGTTIVTNVNCFGANTGSINLTVTGATAPVTYLWSNGAITEDLSGVPAGTYTVTVRDATTCTATSSATVAQPSQLAASSSAPPIATVGGSTTVTVTATGGTPPYTGTGTFVRTAGTYTFTVTDANGCTATTTITLVNPGCTVASTTIVTNVNCFGANTGSINLTVTGATAPVTYLWSNGAITEDLSGVPAGTYTVTVTDGTSCTATASATITQPTALAAVSAAGTIACNGGTTTVNVTATGGTAPYTGTGTFIRTAGAYSYTVTDANGCTSVTSGTITQPTQLAASSTALPITTVGGSTTITVTATGGTAPYTGTGTFVRTAGTYTFTVTDANGCTTTTTITLTEPGCSINLSIAATNVVCFGANTGAVNLTVTGATSPVTYLWSNGATTEDLSGVQAGTYTASVTDATSCTATASATVSQPSTAIVAASTTGVILCNGGTTTVTVTATGGTPPYTGTGTFIRTAGVYSYTVTDANGCTSVTSGTITQPTALVAASVTGTIACNGGSTTVNVTATGGTAPYTGTGTFIRTAGVYSYTVTDANGCTSVTSGTITQPTQLAASSTAPPITTVGGSTTITVTATGGTAPYTGTGTFVRTAGTYTFTVTDANGCTATTTITLVNPVCTINLSNSVTNVLCNGGSTGAVNLTVTGAIAPLTYNWSNGAVTEDISNLVAGTYTVVVTATNSCSATISATVTQPVVLVASSTASTVSCNGGLTTVTVSATGGTPPYAGTGNFTRTAGAYSYTVTDANGCTSVTTGTITQPTALIVTSVAGTIACNGGSTTVTVTVAGGTAPYTGTGTFTRTAGVYSYTVTDANGCTSVTTGNITQPTALIATSIAGTIACNGGTTTVTVTAAGGTAPYTGTGTFTVTAGTYNYTITDSKGCASVTSVIVTQPAVLVTSASSLPIISCNGGSANIVIIATGGTAPYTGTGSFLRSAGTYSFTITDSRGCTATTSVTVTQPSILSAVATAGTISECGGTTLVNVTASGGTTPYPYPGVGTYIRGPGTWNFTVTDAGGCTATTQVTIAAPECLKIYPNPAKSSITINHSKAKAGTVIKIYDINGSHMLTKPVQENTAITNIDINRLAGGNYVLVFYNREEEKKILFEKIISY